MKSEATWIEIWTTEKRPNIELTIRIPLQKGHLELVFCDLLRSVALFWSSDWGDIVFILDEPDRKQDFESKLNNLQLPHKFRFVYEKLFNKESGRESMFYSSFIMDLYTNEDTVIAWTDNDIIFTMPVTDQSIFRNGKLIVKGMNMFWRSHEKMWSTSTLQAIGLPMVSNFMTYFPVFFIS